METIATVVCDQGRTVDYWRRWCRVSLGMLLPWLLLCAATASAQISSDMPPPRILMTDDQGVDLRTGQFVFAGNVLTIGAAGAPALSYAALAFSGAADAGTPRGGGIYEECVPISGHPCPIIIYHFKIGQRMEQDQNDNPNRTTRDGSVWEQIASGFTLTRRDGTVYTFSTALADPTYKLGGNWTERAKLVSITYPNGETLSYVYASNSVNFPRSITSSSGYRLHFEYATMFWPTRVTLINLAVDYCDPNAVSCSNLTVNWPSVSVMPGGSGGSVTATDAAGRSVTTTGWQSGGTLTYTTAAGRSFTLTDRNLVTNCPYTPFVITSVQSAAGTWTYSYGNPSCPLPPASSLQTTPFYVAGVSTNPAGEVLRVNGGTRTDPLGRATMYWIGGTDPSYATGSPEEGGLGGIVLPEGNRLDYSFDARHNGIQSRATPKAGSGLAAMISSASYPASCTPATMKACNQPIFTLDSLGNRTDYTYDAQHGGVLTKTLPAGANGIRPQIRYTYQQLSATYKNASGQLVSGPPIWKLVSTSTCRTQAGCAGTADEIVTTIGYNGNLLPNVETTRSGDGAVSATVTTTYDAIGNVIAIDGPLPGTADTTRFVYNAARERVATMSPDPDGGGPLPVRVTRTTYNADGQPTLIEEGTAADQSDAALATMSVIRQTATDYDAAGRQIKVGVIAGGVTQAVTQHSYNLAGRLECTAVRMNPGAFGSLPASACSLGTEGNDGPDRITRTLYNAAGEVTKVQRGYGTSVQIDYATSTYNPNGTAGTVTDANGNRTTYEYDGFDRLSKTIYPTPGSGTTPSTSDYEELSYDAGSRVTQRRQRDGELIGYGYDALARQTSIDLPDTSGTTNPDLSYAYDNLGHTLLVSDTSGAQVTYDYDALGRRLSENNGLRTLLSQYDASGRRTRLTWPDGFFVDYDHLVTGELSAIRENGASSGAGLLATFGYDGLGRRTSLARGNGTTTSYGYDALRLTGLSQDLTGGGWDNALGFAYNAAGQIVTRTSGNNAYEFPQPAALTRNYTANALNQYTQTNDGTALALGYDGRGNLTSGGVVNYAYDARNLLLSASAGGATFTYDPTSRMRTIGAEGRMLDYDGADLVAEYDTAGQLMRRYVHSGGIDEPIVWYEGAGTANRRWLHADQQGSIVAVSDAAGNALAINTYDPYGLPASTNLGRFQYTGQTWISGIGLAYYKARFYSPKLGRFMQTDPIGYQDDLNLYAYVGNDPLNNTDPTGTCKRGEVFVSGGCVKLSGADTPIEEVVVTATRPRPAEATTVVLPTTQAPAIPAPRAAPLIAGAILLNMLLNGCGDSGRVGACAEDSNTMSATSSKSFWGKLKPYRGKTKTNGESGKKRRYYEKDRTHGDIEVYDSDGRHLGSANPDTGAITKPAVPGRSIDL